MARRPCNKGPCNTGDTSSDCTTRQETNFDNLFNPMTNAYYASRRKICKGRNRNHPFAGCGLGSGLIDKSQTLGCASGDGTGCVAKGGNNNALPPRQREEEAFENQFISGNAAVDADRDCQISNRSNARLPYADRGSGSLNAENRAVCVPGGNTNALNTFQKDQERFDNMFSSGFDVCKQCHK